MGRVEKTANFFLMPAAFFGAAVIARSGGFSSYFPGATKKGVYLSTFIASVGTTVPDLTAQFRDKKRMIALLSIGFGALLVQYGAKEKKGWKTPATYAFYQISAWLVTKYFISRFQRDYYCRWAKRSLSEGMNIDASFIDGVKQAFEAIKEKKDTDEVIFFRSQPTNRVFTLASKPGFIFRMNAPDSDEGPLKERYEAAVQAKATCLEYELDLITIARCQYMVIEVEGKKRELMVEEMVDIEHEESRQEELYEQHASKLEKAVEQLTVLIIKRALSDIEWRNIPIIKNSWNDAHCRIAAIDLDPIKPKGRDGIISGLFGSGYWRRRGLIRCVSPELGQVVLKKAREHLYFDKYTEECAKEAVSKRSEEIEDIKKLRAFYQTHHISNGSEPLKIDQDTLNFESYVQENKLKKLANDLLTFMNEQFVQSPSVQSTKRRRWIEVNTNGDPEAFYLMDHNCPIKGKPQNETLMGSILGSNPKDANIETEGYSTKDTYFHIVAEELIRVGAIYKFVVRIGNGYTLQA